MRYQLLSQSHIVRARQAGRICLFELRQLCLQKHDTRRCAARVGCLPARPGIAAQAQVGAVGLFAAGTAECRGQCCGCHCVLATEQERPRGSLVQVLLWVVWVCLPMLTGSWHIQLAQRQALWV